MKFKIIVIAALSALIAGADADSGDKNKPGNAKDNQRGRFLQLNTGNPPPGKPRTEIMKGGDWMQFHVVYDKTKKGEGVRDLIVEIEGNTIEKIAILDMTVRTELSFERYAGEDTFKGDITCLVKAVKKGKSTINITPIREDGKKLETRSIVISVVKDPPQ